MRNCAWKIQEYLTKSKHNFTEPQSDFSSDTDGGIMLVGGGRSKCMPNQYLNEADDEIMYESR